MILFDFSRLFFSLIKDLLFISILSNNEFFSFSFSFLFDELLLFLLLFILKLIELKETFLLKVNIELLLNLLLFLLSCVKLLKL